MAVRFFTTLSQATRSYKRINKRPSSRTFKLRKNPHVGTIIWRIFIKSPKKPNSGKRRVAKAKIRHVKRRDRVTARLIGYDIFPRKYFRLLIRGGRANDTPGVTYSGVRGAYDFKGHLGRNTRRSFYGLKRPKHKIVHIPKKMRALGITDLKTLGDTREY